MSQKEHENFMRDLLNDFKVEAVEHYQTILNGVLELEKQPDEDRTRKIVETVFRETHSLKGAARVVNLSEIEKLCMSLESVFNSLKKGDCSLSQPMLDLFMQAIGLLNVMLSDAEATGKRTTNMELQQVIRNLEFAQKSGQQLPKSAVVEDHSNVTPVSVVATRYPSDEPEVRDPLFTSDTVRVSTQKLSEILRLSEELIAVKSSLDYYAATLRKINSQYSYYRSHTGADFIQSPAIDQLKKEIDYKLTRVSKEMNQFHFTSSRLIDELVLDVKKTLLQPFKTLTSMVPKLVRDLSKEAAKEVECEINGEDIEIDRRILEEIKDPLIHLIRNAIDHGIEQPQQRQLNGKKPKGEISLLISSLEDRNILLQISDDGKGIDQNQIVETAIRNSYLLREDAETLTEQQIFALIFRSGLSTSTMITDLSGRGLGMAIVEEKITKLGGHISVNSQHLSGTTFNIILPRTLATYRGVLVKVSGQNFTIPTSSVEKVIRIRASEIRTVEEKKCLIMGNETIPLVLLSDVLNLSKSNYKSVVSEYMQVVIITSHSSKVAFIVDKVSAEHEGMVKDMGPQLRNLQVISGATLLGNGKIVLILDVARLVDAGLKRNTFAFSPEETIVADKKEQKKVLVAEDSITIRSMLRTFIESAGYEVKTAVDGLAAYNLLQIQPFDLVVSDIEMPNMNGFELTTKIREHKDFFDIPVVLVTALESADDKQHGLEVGANAYIVKSNFEQSNLIDTIHRLI